MSDALQKHEKQAKRLLKKHRGFLVQTIGDAIFAFFRTLNDAIQFAIALQRELEHTKRIWVDKKSKSRIRVRIGMGYGPLSPRIETIQCASLLNFTGNLANISSRMESKISEVGGFAVTCIGAGNKISDEDQKLLGSLRARAVAFAHEAECKSVREEIARSYRLLFAHGHQSSSARSAIGKCLDPEQLRGVGKLVAFSVPSDCIQSRGGRKQ